MVATRPPRSVFAIAALLCAVVAAVFAGLLDQKAPRGHGWLEAAIQVGLTGKPGPLHKPVALIRAFVGDLDGDPDDDLAPAANGARAALAVLSSATGLTRERRLAFGVADGPGATGPPSL